MHYQKYAIKNYNNKFNPTQTKMKTKYNCY